MDQAVITCPDCGEPVTVNAPWIGEVWQVGDTLKVSFWASTTPHECNERKRLAGISAALDRMKRKEARLHGGSD